MRPLDTELTRTEGVRPDTDGVVRPVCIDATEGDRWPYVDGGDNRVKGTKTPQLDGQMKYCFLNH